MKTSLPNELTTQEAFEAFLWELHINGEFFHLDDDATDIVNGRTGEPLFTLEEGNKINAMLEEACDKWGDVWELPTVSKICDLTMGGLD